MWPFSFFSNGKRLALYQDEMQRVTKEAEALHEAIKKASRFCEIRMDDYFRRWIVNGETCYTADRVNYLAGVAGGPAEYDSWEFRGNPAFAGKYEYDSWLKPLENTP